MVVGNNPSLHMKLISLKHDTDMGGHSGIVLQPRE